MLANGIRIIENKALVKPLSVQKKTHKKKRINKKWLKRYGIKIIYKPIEDIFIMEDMIIGHPKTLHRYLDKIQGVEQWGR